MLKEKTLQKKYSRKHVARNMLKEKRCRKNIPGNMLQETC
jgi:hypothetical protein